MANGDAQIASDLANHPAIKPLLAQVPAAHQGAVLARITAAHKDVMRKSGGGGRSTRQSRAERSLPAERTKLWNTYYSIVRFQTDVSVAAPMTTLTLNAGAIQKPFSYRIGDPMTTAGFDPSFGNATEAETNLTKASETVGGELVKIHGMSLSPSGITDITLWKELESNISVKISMNGDAQNYRLGRMSMIPGSGGVFGSAPSLIGPPPDLTSSVRTDGGFSNGWPDIANFFPFPEPMIWTPGGETDSSLNIVLTCVRQVLFTATARAGTAPAGGALGVAPYNPPTAVGQYGTFIDVMCRLHSEQVAPRSVNQ